MEQQIERSLLKHLNQFRFSTGFKQMYYNQNLQFSCFSLALTQS